MRKMAIALIAILLPWLLFLAALSLLGSCAPTVASVPPDRTIIRPVDLSGLCLEVKAPPPGLADALAPIPADSPIIAAIGDWERMRDQSRACAAKTK